MDTCFRNGDPVDIDTSSEPDLPVNEPVELRELVVCSLEPWDEIWRRNQFLVDQLLRRHPRLRVLFVEPAIRALPKSLRLRRLVSPHLRNSRADSRLLLLRPRLPIPQRFGRLADQLLLRQVQRAVLLVGFEQPTLWINDVTYAPLISRTGWPSLYDVTDDWLLAPFSRREIERLRRLDGMALDHADEVVVCSSALAASRGRARAVTLIPNGVDIAHFRRPRDRPPDLPPQPTAVYVGSLHDARLDVALVADLADAFPQVNIVLVGPDSLSDASRRTLRHRMNVHMLGARSYADVPAYLQHADVVVVPHRISAFTESLDPIKAYECLAVGKPTVATPVAGFRDRFDTFRVVARDGFVRGVGKAIAAETQSGGHKEPVSWAERADSLDELLVNLVGERRQRRPSNLDSA